MTWQEAYRILELSNPKTLEEVREAYGIQAKAWHPDRFEGDAKMHRIETAKLPWSNSANLPRLKFVCFRYDKCISLSVGCRSRYFSPPRIWW